MNKNKNKPNKLKKLKIMDQFMKEKQNLKKNKYKA